MKKITFLLMFFACALFANAQDVSLDFTNNTWGLPAGSANKGTAAANFTSGLYTIILQADAVATDGYYYNTGYLMLGKQNATLTLPAFSFDVEKIEVVGRTGASTNTKQNIFVAATAVSTETTGSAVTNTYVIDAAYQAAGTIYVLKIGSAHNAQITAIKIYRKASASEVQTPAILPASGDYFTSQSVSISCATEGASIYYTTDGTEPTTTSTSYTAPFEVTSTTTVKALAVKVGLTNSAVASSVLTFPTVTDVADIAAFKAAGIADNTKYYRITGSIYAIYQNGNQLYVQDASGAMLIFGVTGQTFASDQKELLTGVIGKYAVYQTVVHELIPAYVPAKTTAASAFTPELKSISGITTADACQYVKLEGVSFSADVTFSTTTATNATLTDGTATLATRDNFKLFNTTHTTETHWDLVGVLNVFSSKPQLYLMSITQNYAYLESLKAQQKFIYAAEGSLLIGAEQGSEIRVFNILGQQLVSAKAEAGTTTIKGLKQGQIVIVKANGKTVKVRL